MTSPDGFIPPGSRNDATVAQLQTVTQESVANEMNEEMRELLEQLRDAFIDSLLGGFGDVVSAIVAGINQFIADLVHALKGVSGGLIDLTGLLSDTQSKADAALSEVTTNLAVSSGPNDIPTFPRMMLAPDKDGNVPSYTPSHRHMNFFWLRSDRSGDFSRLKIIMGGSTSWFDIDGIWLALYRVNPIAKTGSLVWSSENLKPVVGGVRAEYAVNMGQIVHVEQGEILAPAVLQHASGLAQTPRALAILNQVGTANNSSETGQWPPHVGGWLTNIGTPPATVDFTATNTHANMLAWFALSP